MTANVSGGTVSARVVVPEGVTIKGAGVDMSTQKPVEAATKKFADLLDQFEKLNLQNNELSRPVPRLTDGAQMLYDFVYGAEESEAADAA